jgi:pimeloyl-ACP methyl ester carboxylesterase
MGRRHFVTDCPRPVPVYRTDVQLINARGLTLQCSHYVPGVDPDDTAHATLPPPMPVVVYLHGNASCRLEAEALFPLTLSYGMSVFSMDFSGSGRSDGEFISLGVFEKLDVQTAVEHLSASPLVSSIALWGHSMGAATATMYAGLVDPSCTYVAPNTTSGRVRSRRRNSAALVTSASSSALASVNAIPTTIAAVSAPAVFQPDLRPVIPEPVTLSAPGVRVRALVLDSGFASFEKLAEVMIETMPLPAAVPRRLILSVGVRAVRKAVRDQAGFDVHDIDPLSACRTVSSSLPVLFLQGTRDEVVHRPHVDMLYAAYPCPDKHLVVMEGINHDAHRPSYAIEQAFLLLQRTMFDDFGTVSMRYVDAVKVRGNDAMLDGRFADAVILYSAALESLVDQERAARPAASTVTPSDPSLSASGPSSGSSSIDLASAVVIAGRPPSGTPTGTSDSLQSSAALVASKDSALLWPDSDEDEGMRTGVSAGNGFRNGHNRRARWITDRVGSALGGLARRLSGNLSKRSSGSGPGTSEDANTAAVLLEPIIPIAVAKLAAANASTTSVEPSSAMPGGNANQRLKGVASSTLPESTAAASAKRNRASFSSRGLSSLRRSGAASNLHKQSSAQQTSGSRRRLLTNLSFRDLLGDDSTGGSQTPQEQQEHQVQRKLVKQQTVDEYIRGHGLAGERKDIALALICNMSLARLKLKQCAGAIADAELALTLEPTWVRGWQRKATALKAMNKLMEARDCVTTGLSLSPSNAAMLSIQADIEQLLRESSKRHEVLRAGMAHGLPGSPMVSTGTVDVQAS